MKFVIILIEGAKNHPHIAGPILATLVGTFAHGGFSLRGDSLRRDWEDKRSQDKSLLENVELLFQNGLNCLKERRFYDAEKIFIEAQDQFTLYCDLNKSIKNRSDVRNRCIALLANLSKALFLQRKLIAEEKHSSLLNALGVITEWMRLSPHDRDAFNLRGLIYFKQAYFSKQSHCLQQAAEDFRASLSIDQTQTEIYVLLNFTQILLKKNACSLSSSDPEQKLTKELVENYKLIIQHITSGSDIFTNELLFIYAEAYHHASSDSKGLGVALKYIKTAIRCTDDSPAFYIEKMVLHQLCGEYYQKLNQNLVSGSKLTVKIDLVEGYQREFQLDCKQAGLFSTKHKTKADRLKEENKKLQEIRKSLPEIPDSSKKGWCLIS